MHVALYICKEMTWYSFWEQNDHERGNLLCKRLRSKTGQSFVDLLCFFCLVFAMPLYTSVYMCLVVTCWERALGSRLWCLTVSLLLSH